MKGIKKMGRPPAKDPISYSIKIGLNKEWNVDSPIQPNPRETIVIPSCVADK